MLVMGLYVTRTLERHAVENLEATLLRSARLVHDALDAATGRPPAASETQAVAERYAAALGGRVTVIGADGTVLADSARDVEQVREMENHAARPEVRSALAGGVGSDVRRSRTLDVGMLYVAIPLEGPSRPRGVIRLAVPLTEVERASAA